MAIITTNLWPKRPKKTSYLLSEHARSHEKLDFRYMPIFNKQESTFHSSRLLDIHGYQTRSLTKSCNIPAIQLTTSLCCRILWTILPSLNDMTWKLFSQLPHDIKKFSEGVCIVAKHCSPSSTFSGTGIPILRGESASEPTPKNGSCRNWRLFQYSSNRS